MTAFCRSVPDQWSEHEKLASTAKGLAVHAMNLDIDVGPLLQTQKLLDSVIFARRKGYATPLSAAELEMMNLTGDGNGFDMITIPVEMRDQIPTSNFFLRNGYERNPVAIRNNTVAKLLAATNARMNRGETLAGARDLAAAF
jgi:DNA-binding CsgD family transcriptional regulator